jgi:hypothetical protein
MIFTGTAQESDVQLFKALWEAIGPYTKESLTFHIGLLVRATVRGQDDARIEVLTNIESTLNNAASTQVSVVSLFMTMLREASISTVNAMLALAESGLRGELVQDIGQGSDDMSISSSGSANKNPSDMSTDASVDSDSSMTP